ncbi:MAG: ADP-ribosylglycohydrolase family protein [Dysgonamonadaceae bacterium]|jgi:ADP-ribosylglycohydrolase|nr:ADP-ribosylglycohydrolase family protein [Dysgonamonadaceae bacterium]
MLGAIIGDIVGSRFEFNNHKSTDFEFLTNDCAFTDDTVCTIAIADGLINYKQSSFGASLRHWCRKYPNPTGSYGASFARWLYSSDPMPYNSFGNGSAMRVSPCAWFSNGRIQVLDLARKSASCTHNHPEGIRGAMCVADLIFHARNGYDKSRLLPIVKNEYFYRLNMDCDTLRHTNTFNETCQITVPQAIVCFLESTDFESAIRLAVSIGGDSDTIAAITGSIAEPFYGIPEHIKKAALDYLPQEFINVINNFYKHIEQ